MKTAIQKEMPLIMQVTENSLKQSPPKKETNAERLKRTSVYLRRYGVVSESSELYENVNVLNMPELVRPALNKLMQLDSYGCELFIVIALDKKCRMTAASIITQGTLDASLVHPREVFQSAIMNNAASIIVVHNHPSGDSTPSREDEAVTRALIEAGRILKIPVTDHIVLGDAKHSEPGFHSIRRSGEIAFD